ncbi:hypothetical protein [Lederbergia lenta]|uniref:hypothetical protein n=1 Tax=Lederbergia lenta TaxID=1467 RepID=UPI002041ECEF|nr:hypothetical protein [Lederbergia lenta]MCM3111646.1 hypothetical protein [Lederbergia lenta]
MSHKLDIMKGHVKIDELKVEFLEENLKVMFRQAYEQGVKDAQERYTLPHVLKKEHLAEIFQIKMPTVEKIARIPSFPKFERVQARYPRDKVFEWIDDNSSYVEENTNYFNQAIS